MGCRTVAVEPIAKLPNELTFGPSEALVVDGDREQALLAPTVAFDLVGRLPLAAVTAWKESHRATSCSTAA
jgi:hypothetical protein